jgi:hypothetical protein
MSRDRPQPAGNELLIVLLSVFGASPCGFLAVGSYFKEERACKEAERGVIEDSKRGVEVWREGVDHVDRETNEENPGGYANSKMRLIGLSERCTLSHPKVREAFGILLYLLEPRVPTRLDGPLSLDEQMHGIDTSLDTPKPKRSRGVGSRFRAPRSRAAGGARTT